MAKLGGAEYQIVSTGSALEVTVETMPPPISRGRPAKVVALMVWRVVADQGGHEVRVAVQDCGQRLSVEQADGIHQLQPDGGRRVVEADEGRCG